MPYWLSEMFWAIRAKPAAATAAIVVATAAIVLFAVNTGTGIGTPGDSIDADLEKIADMFVTDPVAAAARLDASYIRIYDGTIDRDDSGETSQYLSGTVARLDADGNCRGFELHIPLDWVYEGSSGVHATDIGSLEAGRCDRVKQAG